MNKSMYQVDNSGYRQVLINQVEAIHEKHGVGVQIFGGVLYAYKYIEDNDLHAFCQSLNSVIFDAQFFHWEQGIAHALKVFCELCLVDYMLIEAYLGVSFNDIEDYVLKNCPMKPVQLVA